MVCHFKGRIMAEGVEGYLGLRRGSDVTLEKTA
jgi:hypothetical protein